MKMFDGMKKTSCKYIVLIIVIPSSFILITVKVLC